MNALEVTDTTFHAGTPTNPQSFSRSWKKSVKSGKPFKWISKVSADQEDPSNINFEFEMNDPSELPWIIACLSEAMRNPKLDPEVIQKLERDKRNGTLDSDLVQFLKMYKQTN